ncbi:MAG TPA: RNA polymerase sigma factor [Puia sp.]|jgi:RNA polymerase sigma-70 factor (ECF subfamily)
MAQIIEEFDLDAFKRGDERSFRIIYDKYYASLFAKSSKLVYNDDDIKDLIQNAFLKIWKEREKLNSISHIRNSLFLYTHNDTIKRWKKLCIRGGPSVSPESIHKDFIEPTGDPFREERKWQVIEELYNRKMISMIADENLSDQRRMAIRLHWVENKTISEISKLLDIKTPTVYTHLRQARLTAIEELRHQIPGLLTILWILVIFFEKK